MVLRSVPTLNALYFLPQDDLIGEVIIPCLAASTIYDCMTAFFHSSSERELAAGMAEFLRRPQGHMRLVISPLCWPSSLSA